MTHADHMNSQAWWKQMSIDEKIIICEKYYPQWKWWNVTHSKKMVERMWLKETKV